MHRFPASILIVVVALLSVGTYSSNVWGASGAGTQPNHGYATYQITLSKTTGPAEVFLLNETGQPTGQNGLVKLDFALSSNARHLSYSRIVNSSSLPEIFPYFPGVNNQSVSYSSYGIRLDAHVARSGTTQVTFKGGTYTAQNYELSILVSYPTGKTYSATGNVRTMPSGLIYSVELRVENFYAFAANLIATNLPLTNPSGNTAMFGFALVGLGLAGAIGLAVPSVFAFVRVKSRTKHTVAVSTPETSKPPDKPSHWVD